ncbi:tRNA glutamyl-Q(34) synthetase GluQRS [Methylobacterium nodulans]|uniref:Glutamyl-tRNA synthetase class Ic n=1 Tax=Methylobacterium nodulans (strain LMG 21967 / CNCM I-2342 / ORS 2060) TaxID=460265 RepID=B8IS25_METNO|nr:tRNA glutamyl-Q(34) synthetase GluQRS [Methylobacterium nodulans]ACL56837.1 glutamyl-tRNA synthetase class Ic [Methylobacterium nodulans ORS 2060]
MSPPVFRFAPSPNGRLHLGHAYSALLNAAFADRMQGRLILRLEDIDITRCRPELIAAMLDDLRWLGLPFEEPVRRQSAHFAEYAAALDRLRARGLVYPCFCSRREIAAASHARDPDGAPLYPGTCRSLAAAEAEARIAAGEPHAWRLDMGQARAACPGPLVIESFDEAGAVTQRLAAPERWGDAVLARKDAPTSYHLAVVHDDALQGVTHVVRGRDLDAATDLHRLLQALLGLPAPRYHHHALLVDAEGGKLAKSRGSEPLAALRARGVTAAELRAQWGFAAEAHAERPEKRSR